MVKFIGAAPQQQQNYFEIQLFWKTVLSVKVILKKHIFLHNMKDYFEFWMLEGFLCILS